MVSVIPVNKKLITLIGTVVVLLAVFFITSSINKDKNTTSTIGTTEDVKKLVEQYSLGKKVDEQASITSNELIVTDKNSNETIFKLPDDEFFVSIAPFKKQTHPCEIHSLTGCRGELANEEFQVIVKDKDGKVIVNQTMKSHANGFIDLWLPRNQTYNVTITNANQVAISEITTFENDNTCITTMQLKEDKKA
ncbi:CueP family metal-binding protein [Bacillus andreraoultii]|uniref:CueP family metal-binding protein n=1 Tax=Bacillus andreraoultii TaxID=1499685 RepID=UPI0005A90022|nr:CueP family metal-binding protein [Bacillus andreraoultii]